jgi:phenylalanyl-tRNA synthetase beta chain
VADALVGLGLAETVTIPLISPEAAARFSEESAVVVANPLRAEESVLRPTLLPGLMAALSYNAGRGLSDVALFEMGRVFFVVDPDAVLPHELESVGGVLTGTARRAPVEPDRAVDVYDAVDAVRAITDALGIADVRFDPETLPGFEVGASARVVASERGIGVVGVIAARIITASDVPGPVVAFELDVGALVVARRVDRQFRAASPYPGSNIDLAFVVDDAVLAADIVRTLRDAGGELLEDVYCFDEFRSEQLGARRRSLAFALRFRAPDRTLTDVEVSELRARCIAAVSSAHGAELRG